MTKLTLAQKTDMIQLLNRPMRYSELRRRLNEYIAKTSYRRIGSFEYALRREGIFEDAIILRAENGRTVALYSSTANPTPYDVALGLSPAGYFCNLTSLYYHGLTNQVPSTVYVASESIKEYAGRLRNDALNDYDIFSHFVKTHRATKNIFKFNNYSIVLTERVKRGNVGVEYVKASNRVCPEGSKVTSLERGLIDAVVHPQYNGGIGSVVEFYAVGAKHLNIAKLLQIYNALDFRYPYWQAIGFVCDKTGATKVARHIANHFEVRNKFYIDHLAKDSWGFDSKWQIYFPKGLFQ